MPIRPTVRRLALLAPLIASPCPAPARAELLSTGAECGGDAFSSAQVVERRPPRHGPLTAMPDTLCADLAPQRAPDEVRIDAYPVVTPQVGGGRGRVPYEGAWPARALHDRPGPDRPGPDRSGFDRPGRDRPQGPLAGPMAFPPEGTADHRRAVPPRPE